MTEQKNWLCTGLYIVGITGLACSGIALADVVWLADPLSEARLFDVFYISFATSVGAFMLGCALDIAMIMARTPDPKGLRTNTALESNVRRAHIKGASEEIRRAA